MWVLNDPDPEELLQKIFQDDIVPYLRITAIDHSQGSEYVF